MIEHFCQMIKGVFKIARSVSYDDSADLPKARIDYQGQQNLQAYSHLPYGYVCHPVDGGVAFVCAQNGQQSNPVVIIGNSKLREQRNLKQGEVGLENFLTHSFVLLRENGDIEVNSVHDVVVNAARNVTVEAGNDIQVTAARDITVSASRNVAVTATATLSATCETATINAETLTASATSIGFTSGTMTATISSAGVNIVNGDITVDGLSFKDHVHEDVVAGSDNSGGPVQP